MGPLLSVKFNHTICGSTVVGENEGCVCVGGVCVKGGRMCHPNVKNDKIVTVIGAPLIIKIQNG